MVGAGVGSFQRAQVSAKTANPGWASLINDFLATPLDTLSEQVVLPPEIEGTGKPNGEWRSYCVRLKDSDRELLRRVQQQPAELWIDETGTLHEAIREVCGTDDDSEKKGFGWLLDLRSQIMMKLGIFLLLRQQAFFLGLEGELLPFSVRDLARGIGICPTFAYGAVRNSHLHRGNQFFPLKMFFCQGKKVHPFAFRRWVWNVLAHAEGQMTDVMVCEMWNKSHPATPDKRLKLRDFHRMAGICGINIKNVLFLPVIS